MVSIPTKCDVIVVGSGNAALTAAISAKESGANVVVFEKAPEAYRGGNSTYTGGIFRFVHDGQKDVQEMLPELTVEEIQQLGVTPYTRDDYYNDLMIVTEGLADPELAEIVVNNSLPTIKWMTSIGIKWELLGSRLFAVAEQLKISREEIGERIRSLLRTAGGGVLPTATPDGGVGLVRQEHEVAQKKGIDIFYEVGARRLIVDRMGRVTGVTVKTKEGFVDVHSKAVILACGSFEANAEMRTKYWGSHWNVVRNRGTPYNTGEMLRECLNIGAKPDGHWAGQHASAMQARAKFVQDPEISPPLAYSFNYSITINQDGQRFIDEGEDVVALIYAKMGREILAQRGSVTYQIYDAKVDRLVRLGAYLPEDAAVSETIEGLADQLGFHPQALKADIERFNKGVTDAPFNPLIRDGKASTLVTPPKSNWAQPIDTPPFKAWPVVCGLTFAFAAVKTNALGQVINTEEEVIPGLYAAGEIGGGLFYHNYPGAGGLMKGAVMGKISGASAAGGG